MFIRYLDYVVHTKISLHNLIKYINRDTFFTKITRVNVGIEQKPYQIYQVHSDSENKYRRKFITRQSRIVSRLQLKQRRELVLLEVIFPSYERSLQLILYTRR